MMFKTIMHDIGDVNVDADVITLPLKKAGRSREITPKKEYAVQFWAVRPLEQVDCCVFTVSEALPQNLGRLLDDPEMQTSGKELELLW